MNEERQAEQLVIQLIQMTAPRVEHVCMLTLRALAKLSVRGTKTLAVGALKVTDAGLSHIDGLGSKGIVSLYKLRKQAGNQSLTFFDVPNGMEAHERLRDFGKLLQKYNVTCAIVNNETGQQQVVFASPHEGAIATAMQEIANKYLSPAEQKEAIQSFPHYQEGMTAQAFQQADGTLWEPVVSDPGTFTTRLELNEGCYALAQAHDSGAYEATVFNAQGRELYRSEGPARPGLNEDLAGALVLAKVASEGAFSPTAEAKARAGLSPHKTQNAAQKASQSLTPTSSEVRAQVKAAAAKKSVRASQRSPKQAHIRTPRPRRG